MKTNSKRLLPAVLTACAMTILSACGAKSEPADMRTAAETASDDKNQTDTVTEGQDIPGSRAEDPALQAEAGRAARKKLSDMTNAIEAQYPEQTFTDIPEDQADISPLLFGGAYEFSGRKSSDGWEYIAAVCTVADNPLEGMTCGTGSGVPGFNMSQFADGKILLLERGDGSTSGLSFLYDTLQQGESGVEELVQTAARGVSRVPPAGGAFMMVSMVKSGREVTEFIPLTKKQVLELEGGDPLEEAYSGRLAVCESREQLAEARNGGINPPTKQMMKLAEEKSGFEAGRIEDIRDLTKAVMRTKLHGEVREETVENKSDLELLASILSGAVYEQTQIDGDYDADIALTKQDGTVMTVQLAAQGGGYILGNAVSCGLTVAASEEIRSVFTTLEGWKRYGGQIRIDMKEESYSAADRNLTFTLQNDTGKHIDYILSPIIYKKSDETAADKSSSWKQMAGIAGFCGVTDDMDGNAKDLSVPWKDNFELEGDGTYRLEIQVSPEPGIRFPVSDTFEVK